MNDQTQFNLDSAILKWRENLAQSPALRRENLDELETHLRDSIGTLCLGTLSAEEGFIIAVKRIGREGTLQSEFGKVNGKSVWLDRILWMLIGFQLLSFLSSVVTSATRSAVFFGLTGYDFKTHGHLLPAIILTFAQLLGLGGSLAVCWWLISKRGKEMGVWTYKTLQLFQTWSLTVVVLFIVSCCLVMLNYGRTELLLKFVKLDTIVDVSRAQSYSSIVVFLVQTVALMSLTILLVRKRFGLIKA